MFLLGLAISEIVSCLVSKPNREPFMNAYRRELAIGSFDTYLDS